MIGVASDPSRRIKGEQYLWTKFPDAQREIGNYALHVQPVQLAVGIVEDNSLRNFQDFAGGCKFLAPPGGQFLIVARSTAIGGRLPRGQANDRGFHSALAIKTQAPAEAAGFVIRMRSHHHHAPHAGIVSLR